MSEVWETDASSNSDSSLSDDDIFFDPAAIESRPLLPVPPDVSCVGDKLCATCAALDLTPRRFVVLPGDKEYGRNNQPDKLEIQLGAVTNIVKRTNCPLCRLVLVALGGSRVPTHQDGEPVVVTMSWNTDGPRPDPSAPWSHVPEIRILRPYAQTESGGFIHSVMLNIFPEITLLANDAPTPKPSPFFVRPIAKDAIDLSAAKRWIAICCMNHRKTCRTTKMMKELDRSHPAIEVPSFRCINVVQNCLANPPLGASYAALSYTWGRRKFFCTLKANVEELEKPGALVRDDIHYQIPATIQDAMQVAREVGLKYLWVDSLCIVQDDDSGVKIEAIKMMDLIYAAADIVIVAAGSADAYAGIPGVQKGSRCARQPIEEIGPDFRLAYKTRLQDNIHTAAYYTRAWTYQETHFATRSLVFIDGQVIFRCQAVDSWGEHLVETDAEIHAGHHTRGSGPFEGDDIGVYEGIIQDYSQRVLSFDADIYHAFAGVSRRISLRLHTQLCHGLPARFFDWFLLWGPLSDLSRRPNAPSWSWAGWIGGTFPRIWDWYNRSIRSVKRAIEQRTWIVWYERYKHGNTLCTLVHEHGRGRPGSSKRRNFYGAKVPQRKFLHLDCSKTKPTERILGQEVDGKADSSMLPSYSVDVFRDSPGSGFLQFWTVSIMLQINEPTSADNGPGAMSHGHRLSILGKTGRELGFVNVPPSWLEGSGALPQDREFILICEGREERAEHGRIDDEDGWRFMAMMIEWHGEYAERVGIGSIGKDDLEEGVEGGISWKEIILG